MEPQMEPFVMPSSRKMGPKVETRMKLVPVPGMVPKAAPLLSAPVVMGPEREQEELEPLLLSMLGSCPKMKREPRRMMTLSVTAMVGLQIWC
jgi:hypothetical protein